MSIQNDLLLNPRRHVFILKVAMNIIVKSFVSFVLVFFLSNFAWATGISAPEIKASSYLLVDFHSGVELAEKNADKQIEPASITKLMTAYVIYKEISKGNISLKDNVLISKKAWKMEGSRMFVEAGKKVNLNKVLHGLVVQSGNDAAVALSEHISGSETSFVAKMNEEAAALGMKSTKFQNSTGWPAENH